MDAKAANQLNVLTLAYIGDAVYELKVREFVLENCSKNSRAAHTQSVKMVCAASQSEALLRLMDDGAFTDPELALIKRARNHHNPSRAKNATPMEYSNATALEALIGYLHLIGDQDRLATLISSIFSLLFRSL